MNLETQKGVPNSGLKDPVAPDSLGAREIGFQVPDTYNASELLFQHLENGNAEKTAVISGNGDFKYRTLCAQAAQTGHALASLGLARGERVLLLLDDRPAYPSIFFGAIRAGFVPMLLNTLSTAELVTYYATNAGARVAIVDQQTKAVLDAGVVEKSGIQTIIYVDTDPMDNSGAAVFEWSSWIERFSDTLEPADTLRNDMAFWMYSSGSTGRPKGIVHLQHDMLYSAESYGKHILELSSDDICFSVPKIFFAYGLGNSIVFPFSVGATAVYLEGRPTPEKVFETIRKTRPTLFFGLPTLYKSLLQSESLESADLSSVRLCLSAAEVLSEGLFNSWSDRFGLKIVEGLGSTEMTHIYLSNLPNWTKPRSAGKPVPGYEVKLVDAKSQTVVDGEDGVMCVRADSSAPFYWNRPDETAKTMREDWIYTGDRFGVDQDGFYYFKGRADDLIKVSGQWVYPLEIEQCLSNHSKIKECAVLGISQDEERMTLKAFVVPIDGVVAGDDLTADLQNYVKKALIPYKYPRIVEYLDALPKTGTGKIDRQQLLAAPDKT